ncbi:hypothetical protein ROZALSC1DRAFT_28894 [Rozella allomycis CSF55]|uniref:GOLD domain-containing protein n=1 Tax=Rozella allomycis (strain CSF55) TaxID=988480 RepID=A0A4P9YIV6_ROZAC|nr:hypothetical protein ROZALSC1DRAFT_28894 [Rozella allomycis CSF55]
MFKSYLALLALSCVRSTPVAPNDSVEFRISENFVLKSSEGFAVFDSELKDYEFSYSGKDQHKEKGTGSVILVDNVHTLLSLKSSSSTQKLEDVENDTPVLGLSFQHGNHKEMVKSSIDVSGFLSGLKKILIMAVVALVLIIALFWA